MSSEQIINTIFSTSASRVFFVEERYICFVRSEGGEKVRFIKEGNSIVCGVLKTKKHRISHDMINDEMFEENFDIASHLAGITFPVFDPLTREIIAVIQVVLWQEAIYFLRKLSIEKSIQSQLDRLESFSLFFGFHLSSFKKNNKGKRAALNQGGRKSKE